MNRLPLIALATMALALVMGSITGCNDDSHDRPPIEPRLELLIAPTALLSNIDSSYVYWVRVDNSVADSVVCTIQQPHGPDSSFALFDDGAAAPLGDRPSPARPRAM